MIVGICFAAVVTLVVGLLMWQSGSGDGPGTPVADDGVDRTVGLLTEKDPVCDDWIKYADELADETREWDAIDKTISAASWSPEQRDIVERAADAMRSAADQFESILPKANDVVLQELIAQTIVYWRAFVDRVQNYVRGDSMLAGTAGNFGSAATFMCTAVPIILGRDLASEAVPASSKTPAKLSAFIRDTEPSCSELTALMDRQDRILRGWSDGDPAKRASEWSADERRLNQAAIPVLVEDGKRAVAIAQTSTNPVLADLVQTYVAYMNAFADALPTYEPDDHQLWKVATFLGGGLGAACEAQL